MINYQLKSKDTSKPQPVYAYLTGYFKFSSERLKISVGKSILPTDFGNKGENYRYSPLLIKSSKKPAILVFKRVIEDFESAVSRTELHFLGVSLRPTKEEFKHQLLINLGKAVKQEAKSSRLVDFINAYCDECRELVSRGQKNLKDTSIEKYELLITDISNYEEYKRTKLKIEDISYDIYNEIVSVKNSIAIGKIVLKNNHQKSKSKINNKNGYSVSTLATFTMRLKFILSQAQIRGFELNKSLHLNDSRLNITKSENAKDFYFSDELLNKIYRHKPLKTTTQHAKDYIMIASTTGMRYQSVALLHLSKPQLIKTKNNENFYAVKNIAGKTGIELLSPLMQPALEVYKRERFFPKFDSLTTLIRCIRALLVEMNINDKVTIKYNVYGVGLIEEKMRLYDVAGSHICRASFITNLLNLSVDRYKVQAMTHKAMNDGTAFSIYDRRSEVDRAIEFYEATKDIDSEFYRYK